MKRSYADLSRARDRILELADDALRADIDKLARTDTGERPAWVRASADALRRLTAAPEGPGRAREMPVDYEIETIVQRVGRPVLAVQGGQAALQLDVPDSAAWKNRLQASAPMLAPVLAAVGRIEVVNHPLFEYVGTGWLVTDDLVVTNRHVALEFAERTASGWTFQIGFDRKAPIGARIDYLEEIGNVQSAEVPISEVVYVGPDDGPDVAFLRLRPAPLGSRPRPVPLASAVTPARTVVATIGYPARDSRIPERDLMDRIFGGVYDKKRLAPGFVTGVEPGTLLHDCTTLGGNSGSVVVDLATGEAAGLHFAGTFLTANYAVAAPVVAERLAEARRAAISLDGDAASAVPSPRDGRDQPQLPPAGGELTVTVPVEITVRIGAPPAGGTAGGVAAVVAGAAAPPVPVSAPVSREAVARAVERARRELGARPDVVSIEAGWRFDGGWITDQRAVVVAVRHKLPVAELAARGLVPLPRSIGGVPVDVTFASAADLLRVRSGEGLEKTGGWVSNYVPRPDLPLEEVDEPMTVVAHASPDAGWPVLEAFLQRTSKRLTIGMYDFTAPHIVAGVEQAVPGSKPLKLVLQAGESLNGGTKKDDIPDADTVADLESSKSGGFEHAWASVHGPQRIFDSAYHIKVAVRDGEEFWLSSGNWQSSNQPALDPIDGEDETPPALRQRNREWHAVVAHAGLAALYEKHLARDLEDAKAAAVPELPAEPELWVPLEYFQPTAAELESPVRYVRPLVVERKVRVQPLLTPDNYAARVLALVRSATERVYFQNQSLSILEGNDADYQALLDALLDRQRAGLDVRLIIRRIGDLRQTVSRIKDFGFDTDRLRLQTNCHTKGIVVDGARVLLGSHNWTNAGTVYNRDASLIFFDQEIAAYFEQLFLYDWGRAGKPKIDESVPAVEWVSGDESVPRPGRVRMPASRWFGP